MDLPALLEAIAADLRTLLGSRAAVVDVHAGRFTAAELRRYATRAPAVLLACLRVSDLDQAGEHRQSASLNLAAFVLATDRDGTPRASVALDLAGRVMAILSLRRWANEKDGWPGIPEHEQRVIDPATVEATNLYAADIDTQGVALWAVSWQQTFTLTPPTPPEA